MLGFSIPEHNKTNKKYIKFSCEIKNSIGSVEKEDQRFSP